MGPFVKFCQLPVHRETFLELQSIFCIPVTLRQILATFLVAGRISVYFRQLSLWPDDFP